MDEKELRKKMNTLMQIRVASGTVGFLAGCYFAYTKGGGFWKYVGFGFLGSMATGLVGALATLPLANEVVSLSTSAQKPEEKEPTEQHFAMPPLDDFTPINL